MSEAAKADFINAQDKIQVRFVTIPPTYFAANGIDEAAVSNMSYAKLINTLGVTP